METPNELIVKTRPFFLNYFNKLANDLHTLTAAQVSCSLGEILILDGRPELESLFETDLSMAFVNEDGTSSGYLFMLFDVATSIALTGLMMMMGESIIKEQVKSRQFSEEILEGFQEVANQVVGSMNELVERKVKGGGHLHLDETRALKYGDFPEKIIESDRFLKVSLQVQVSSFPPQTAYWVLSQGFAEALLGIAFPGEDEESAAAAAKLAGGGVDAKGKKTGPGGVDLSAYASIGVDPSAFEKRLDLGAYAGTGMDEESGLPDLDAYADAGVDPDGAQRRAGADLSKFGGERPKFAYSTEDGLPGPDEPNGVAVVMVETPFSLKEEEKVIKAINAMRRDGYRYIGVDDSQGRLVRVITQSDLRQLMGPFFGTKAMTTRDKAICTVPLNKINKDQKLIRIPTSGTINQAADLITEFELRALPVVSKAGVLRGFIPIHALLSYFRRKKQKG